MLVEFPIPDDSELLTSSVKLTRIGDRLYRIEEIPIGFLCPVESADYLDVIEVEAPADDGDLRFVRVARPSGWRTFGNFGVSSPIIVKGRIGQSILQQLIDRGGMWDLVAGGLLYICLPPSLQMDPSRWAPSLDKLNDVIRLNPKCADAYHERGLDWAFRTKGNHGKAIEDFDVAISLDPTNVAFYLSRARSRHCKEEYETAVEDYDTAIRFDSTNPLCFIHRGTHWLNRKVYTDAVKDFDEAIRLGTLDWRSLLEIDLCGRVDSWSDLLNSWAQSFAEVGHFDAAVRYQTKALEDPAYRGSNGEKLRHRLELYKQKKRTELSRDLQ